MAEPLTIVAVIRAVPGREEELAAHARGLVAPTLREVGCLQYDLHRDLEESARFLFFENWETRESWLAHMDSPHLRAYREATADLVADTEIFQMTRVG